MNNAIEITAGRLERVRRLRLFGPVDDAVARELLTRVWTEGAPDEDAIVLDLTAVTSIDPRALAALFRLKELLGRRLRIDIAPSHDGAVGARRARPRSRRVGPAATTTRSRALRSEPRRITD